jgi:hypothetical protein
MLALLLKANHGAHRTAGLAQADRGGVSYIA